MQNSNIEWTDHTFNHKPIAWESLAMIGFANNRPVIITSVQPSVMLSAIRSVVVDDADVSEEWADEFDEHLNYPELCAAANEVRWELHPVEIAKEIFALGYRVSED